MTPEIKQKYWQSAKDYGSSNQAIKDWIAEGKPQGTFHREMIHFCAGAAHAEKEAYNRAIEHAKLKVLANAGLFRSNSRCTTLIADLEKLKQP